MATTNIDAFDWLRKQMDAAPNDSVKELLSQMVIRLMDTEVESGLDPISWTV